LSRLAFHSRRASASVLLPNSEVVEEVCSAKAKKEEKLNMRGSDVEKEREEWFV
jgi:hypothetical protein